MSILYDRLDSLLLIDLVSELLNKEEFQVAWKRFTRSLEEDLRVNFKSGNHVAT